MSTSHAVGSGRAGPGADPGGPVRVAVLGAGGRLGSVVCAALESDPRTELAVRLGRDTPRSVLAGARAAVAVEVSVPGAVLANTGACLAAGMSVVVGTSGVGPAELAALGEMVTGSPGAAVLVVPNFALGSVLTSALAATAARFMASVEIVEAHHDGKRDAPSGTARRTAALVAAARARAGLGPVPDATGTDPDGARGAVLDGIHVHAVRLPGVVAAQEVLFGGTGETLTIRHESLSRESFAAGAVLAALAVPSMSGLSLGLESVLGL